DVRLPGLLADAAEQRFLTGLELVLDCLHGIAVIVAVEGRGQRTDQLANQTLHIVAQGYASPGRQAQHQWLVRRAEVVDVAPVRRLTDLSSTLRKQVAHDGML